MLTSGLPDLVVSSASVPTSVVAGNGATYPFKWVTTDQSANPVAGPTSWVDSIYISSSSTFNQKTATFVTSQYDSVNTLLHPGGAFTDSVRAAVPPIAPGNDYLFIVTNADGGLTESDTTNNVATYPITVSAPDVALTVGGLGGVPASVVAGDNASFTPSWTIGNSGKDPALAARTDSVYLSTTPDMSGKVAFLTSVSNQNYANGGNDVIAVPAGGSVAESNSVDLSNIKAGSYYVVVAADVDGSQYVTNSTSEVAAAPITITRPKVDLAISQPLAPATLTEGSQATLGYTVANEGTDPAAELWYDAIYASPTPTYDPATAVYVGEGNPPESAPAPGQPSVFTPLAPGATYTYSHPFTIPQFATGSGYLLFVANNDAAQAETDQTFATGRSDASGPGALASNNFVSVPVTFQAPSIAISGLSVPSTANEGDSISLRYTVTNTGTIAAPNSWSDAVYLSSTPTLDTSKATYVTSINPGFGGESSNTVFPLAAGASYSINQSVTIPSAATGPQYLFVVADQYNDQPVSSTSTTLASAPITLSAPDLVVTTVSALPVAVIGQSMKVTYTVQNQGSTPADGSWSDTVYLSPVPYYDDTSIPVASFQADPFTPVPAGSSYTRTQEVNLTSQYYFDYSQHPFVPGSMYLVVVANSSRQQGETSFANNAKAAPIAISAPDLTVASASLSSSAITEGGSETLTYTVANLGASPAPGTWSDAVYLSSTPTFDPTTATYVTSFGGSSSSTPLASGGSYTKKQTFTIPQFALGDQYLIVVTDSDQGQLESNPGNDSLSLPITLSGLDLQSTALSASVSKVTVNDSLTVNWSAINNGPSAAPGSWYDAIYLSSQPTLSGNYVSLGSFQENKGGNLASGASYSDSQKVTVPAGALQGDVYLIVQVNATGNQPETDRRYSYATDANDLTSIPISVTAPDLVVSGVTASPSTQEVGSGKTLSVSWTVTNSSAQPADGAWYDEVYLSPTPTYDPSTARSIDSFSAPNALASAASYTQTQSITLNSSLMPGSYYVIVVTNAYGYSQGESDVNNNAGSTASAITLIEPAVVLDTTTGSSSISAIAGQSQNITYTVTNNGTEPTTQYWNDTIYIGTGPTHSPSDTSLGYYYPSYNSNLPLSPGASYQATTAITVPGSIAPGNYTLFIVADDGGSQGASGGTNVASVPITVTSPNLTLESIDSPPASMTIDNSYTIAWTVKNTGSVPAASYWTDDVYLTYSPVFKASSATFLGSSSYDASSSPLAPGQTYSLNAKVTIPNNIEPVPAYLWVFVNQYQDQGETTISDNTLSAPVTILSPNVDLKVSNASFTGTSPVTLGSSIPITWTVTNGGTDPAAADWVDAVYVSDQPTIDATSIYLDGFNESANAGLATGASYTENQTVYLGQMPVGARYLVFVANSDQTQLETDTSNNSFAVPITLAAPDLVVTDLTAPSSLSPGSTVPVSWTVTNQGTTPTVVPSWYDLLTLDSTGSTAQSYTVAELLETHTLQPGESYTVNQNVTIPAVSGGAYDLTLHTNLFSGQPESDLTNNTRSIPVTTGSVDLTAGTLAVGATPTFNQPVAFTWVDTNGGNSPTNAAWQDTLYISSSSTFDSTAVALGSITVASLAAGASATETGTFTLPIGSTTTAGKYYFYVRVDANQAVAETDLTNNLASAEADVALPPLPNLVPTSIVTPLTGKTGQPLTISWTDVNQGTADATTPWSDAIYASPDGKLNDATLLGSVTDSQGLVAGASVPLVAQVNAPAVAGTYTIVIVVNSNNGVLEGPNAADDAGLSSTTVSIAPNPLSDLVVTAITPPASGVFSGQTVPITFTVQNVGPAATNVPVWQDAVILSQDPTLTYDGGLGAHDDQLLNNQPVVDYFNNPSYLASGDSYQNTVDVTIPNSAAGPWYVYVVTNGLGFHHPPTLSETNRGNNLLLSAAFNVQLTPPPDLTVTSVAPPPTAFSGQPMTLQWTVSNKGTGPTTVAESSWNDTVFLSPTATFDSKTAINLGTFPHFGVLAAGDNYTQQQTVTLPVGVSGSFYFFVQTDSGGAVFENGQLANNLATTATATTVNLTPPPVLTASAVDPSTGSVLAGHSLLVGYTVTNTGASATVMNKGPVVAVSWTDAFYLSPTPTYDAATAVSLGTLPHSGSLAAGASYSGQASLTVPNGLSGNYYVLVKVDSDNQVFVVDATPETAASGAAIHVASKPADLVVSSISSAPETSVDAAAALSVTWSVANQGSGDTILNSWSDGVYLSTSPDLSNPVLLGTFTHQGTLNAGGSYTTTQSVTIPATTNGTFYLFVVTNILPPHAPDGTATVYETNTANDTSARLKLTAIHDLADLRVRNVSETGPLATGQAFTVSWTTVNAGTAATNALSWYDDVWLSTQPDVGTGGTDVFLGSYYRNNALKAGGSYDASLSVTIPQTLAPGSYYVVVRADRPTLPQNLYDASTVNRVAELDEKNNDASTARLPVAASPTPILAVSAVTAGAPTAIAGQPLSVGWTVTNNGIATPAQTTLIDAVFLGLDSVFDPRNDIYLGYLSHGGGLGAGQSYNASATLKVPQGLAGTYYVFVATNYGNQVFVGSNTAGQVGVSTQTVGVTVPAPTDLVAGTITIPANAVPGTNMSLTYTVTNKGPAAAEGDWTDSLYLSKTPDFVYTDPLFATNSHTGGLAVNSSYTGTVTAPVPAVAPGTYYLILRTDVLAQVPATSTSDRISASVDTVSLDVPSLVLGSPAPLSLTQGQSAFYKVDVPAGQTLRFTLADSLGSSQGDVNELYVSFNAIPTREQADLRYTDALGSSQSITVPTTQAGTYYVLAYAESVAGTSAKLTLTAAEVPFSVSAVAPAQAGNRGKASFEIDGAKFDRGTTFALKSPAGATLAASATTVQDSATAFATFDLSGAATGAYTLVATSSTGAVVQLNGGVTVNPGAGSNLTASITGPPFVLPNRLGEINISYGNTGDADAGAPLIFVLSPTNNAMYLPGPDSEGLNSVDNQVFLAVSQTGPAGTLRPGTGFSQPLNFQSQSATGAANQFQLVVVPPNATTPLDWNEVEHWILAVRTQLPNWNTIDGQLRRQIGSTWGDFVQMLDRNASLLVKDPNDVSGNPADVPMLLDIEVQKAIAAVDTSVSGTLSAIDPSTPIAGQEVVAIDSTNNRSYAAVSYNDGSFIFPNLAPGTYTLSVTGERITAGSTSVTVTSGQHASGVALTVTGGAKVSGQILDQASNQPIAGATVTALNLSDRSEVTATTDANGFYTLSGLASTAYELAFDATGHARSLIPSIDLSAANALESITLAPESQIKGTIDLSSGGQAESTLLVSAEPNGGTTDPLQIYTTTSTSTVFTLDGLPAGSYDVTISLPGYVPQTIAGVAVSAGGSADLGTVDLVPVATISGKVSSSDPSTAATDLVLSLTDGAGDVVGTATTDASGAFTFTNVAPGTYTIGPVLSTAVASPLSVTVTPAQNLTNQAITLQPGAIVQGVVTDTRTGSALPGVSVTLTEPDGSILSAVTDGTGTFTFPNLNVGTYTLSVAQGAASPAQVSIDANELDAKTITRNIALKSSAMITGTLTDSTGAVVGGGTVVVYQNGKAIGSTTTAADGSYGVLLLTGGTFDLQAAAPGLTFAGVSGIVVDSGASVTEDFQAGKESLSLSLVDPNQPIAGATVSLLQQVETGWSFVAQTTADSTGVVNFGGLAPGTYRVIVQGANDDGADQTVVVSKTGDPTINLTKQGSFGGKVTDTKGAAIPYASVELVSTTNPDHTFVTTADENGVFAIHNVPDESYTAVVTATAYQPQVVTVVVTGSVKQTVQLTSVTTGAQGQILDGSNQPVPGAIVNLLDAAGHVLAQTTTDANGYYTLQIGGVSQVQIDVIAGGKEELDPVTFDIPLSATNYVQVPKFSLPPTQLLWLLNKQQGSYYGLSSGSGSGLFPTYKPQAWLEFLWYDLGGTLVIQDTYPIYDCPECDDKLKEVQKASKDVDQAAKKAINAFFKLESQVYKDRNLFASNTQKFIKNLNTLVKSVYNAAVAEYEAYGPSALFLDTINDLENAVATLSSALAGVEDAASKDGTATVFAEKDIEKALDDFDNARDDVASVIDRLVSEYQTASFATNLKGYSRYLQKFITTVTKNAAFLGTDPYATLRTDVPKLSKDLEDYFDKLTEFNLKEAEFFEKVQDYSDCYDEKLTADPDGDDCDPNDEDDKNKKPKPPNPPPPGQPIIYIFPVTSIPTQPPHDPNEIVGPVGYGDQNFVPTGAAQPYTVLFENTPGSAPAQQVVITEKLDPALNWYSFRLGNLQFGQTEVSVPANSAFYQGSVDLTSTLGYVVDITAGVDVRSGVATWTFTTIDPKTGQPPLDPAIGFLPGDDASGDGEGSVSYTIDPRSAEPDGTVIHAQATVVFDTQPPLDTATIFNTLSSTPPATQITSTLPPAQKTATVSLQWAGQASPGTAGIAGFNVYVSDDGGAYQPLLMNTTSTRTTFVGLTSHTYQFYTEAVDNTGQTSRPSAPQSVTILTTPPPRPAAPALTPSEQATPGSGRTTVKKPVLIGTTEPGLTVELLDASGKVLTTTRANGSGAYTVTVPTVQSLGSHQFAVRVVDAADNVSAASPLATVTIVNGSGGGSGGGGGGSGGGGGGSGGGGGGGGSGGGGGGSGGGSGTGSGGAGLIGKVVAHVGPLGGLRSLDVTFKQPLASVYAGLSRNYSLLEWRLGVVNHRLVYRTLFVPIKRAVYNPTTHTTTLYPKRIVNARLALALVLNGRGKLGLHDATGRLIDQLPNGKLGPNPVVPILSLGGSIAVAGSQSPATAHGGFNSSHFTHVELAHGTTLPSGNLNHAAVDAVLSARSHRPLRFRNHR